ncbi:hypothetical protein, partial [Salmonella sp. s51933]|uniref:hypothetical protein n=1 Tax=Salmonella sp. s51933 TaxID=3160127 RepID=UPI0037545539
MVKLQLRLGNPKLRKDKHKDNEAIQFDFDLVKDNPEKISKELTSSGYIDASSMQLVTKTIKDCVELVKRSHEKGASEEKEKGKEK